MRHCLNIMVHRKALGAIASALALAVALSLVPGSDAWARDGGRGKHYKHRSRHQAAQHWHGRNACRVVHRPVVHRPYVRRVAYAACAPRYVHYQPRHVVVVRPTPFVTVAGRIGPVDVSAVFGPQARYDTYAYGCNFCDAHYGSWNAWQSHVSGCDHRPQDVQVVYEHWNTRNWDDREFEG